MKVIGKFWPVGGLKGRGEVAGPTRNVLGPCSEAVNHTRLLPMFSMMSISPHLGQPDRRDVFCLASQKAADIPALRNLDARLEGPESLFHLVM